MRFAIVGAGATGGLIGARLARAGHEVTLIARGAHLEALRREGLRVVGQGEDFTVRPEATDRLEAAGSAEFVFLTLKAHSLPPMAEALGRALRPEATVVSAQNGIPWWYFQRHGGDLEGISLESVDPGGVLGRSIDPAQILACIVYPATQLASPGVVRHVEGDRLSLGELDGSRSERSLRLSEALTGAGFKAPVRGRIREELWVKLLGNAAFNPLSALTGATLAEIVWDESGRDAARGVMTEVYALAAAVGIAIPVGIERRIEAAGEVGEHKPSMLQDVEAGRPLEVEALLGALVELGARLSVEVPRLETLCAATRLLDRRIRARS